MFYKFPGRALQDLRGINTIIKPVFPTSYIMAVLISVTFIWEVIVRFVDTGGIC